MGYRSIAIRQDEYPGVTSVPNEFIDRFMAQAPGEYVKVYLYLLRCLYDREGSFSFARAARLLDSSEGDIRRALLFWEDMGLLRLDCSGDTITGLCLCDASSCMRSGSMPTRQGTDAQQRAADAAETDEIPDCSAAKLRVFTADAEIGQMIFVAEQYLGHRLGHRELCGFYYWYTVLSFPPELIIDLVDLCVSDGAADITSLHRCALEWHAAQVHTAADARRFMKKRRADTERDEAACALGEQVCRVMGITGRQLSDDERSRLRTWSQEWGFSDEMICEACRRSVANTHQASFDYAQTVLRNWRKADITDLDGVRADDEAYRARRAGAARSHGKAASSSPAQASSAGRSRYDELALLTMANI